MQQITKIIETETGHRLTSYQHKCAHLHGHRLRWEVTVTALELDDVGFIMDYKDLKVILNDIIDPLDHAFLLHDEDPLIKQFDIDGVRQILRASNGDEPRLFILPFNPTSENLVDWVANQIDHQLNINFKLVGIRLWETSSSYCDWKPDTKENPDGAS